MDVTNIDPVTAVKKDYLKELELALSSERLDVEYTTSLIRNIRSIYKGDYEFLHAVVTLLEYHGL